MTSERCPTCGREVMVTAIDGPTAITISPCSHEIGRIAELIDAPPIACWISASSPTIRRRVVRSSKWLRCRTVTLSLTDDGVDVNEDNVALTAPSSSLECPPSITNAPIIFRSRELWGIAHHQPVPVIRVIVPSEKLREYRQRPYVRTRTCRRTLLRSPGDDPSYPTRD
ncbi:hypothetical protein SAMN05421858_5038 [Haladaptatus litoreus]|uniref:Uncharacterized protein n=1 Tax=Haladaptatus litoreus TaxID=553468 RepID=A0A1N7FFG1_9EURY|nr:hypothetical protein SAMN05421858_5038 [Haladaptatus litoreus]